MFREKQNIVNEQYGQLTVIEELESHVSPSGTKERMVKVRCSCGKEYETYWRVAKKSGRCRSCSDLEKRKNNLTGQKFGKLTVLSDAEDYISPQGVHLRQLKCICDCGNITIANRSQIVTGKTRSCGCILNTKGLLKDNAKLVEKYDFEKNEEIGLDFNSLTSRTDKKAWWKCKICGNSWFATIASQNDEKDHGCPYCSGRLVIEGKTDFLSQFPDVAEEWNYEKNDLKPNEISKSSSRKVWWKCKDCGNEWKQTVANRTFAKSRCPKCSRYKTTSFHEQAIFYYIKQLFNDAINGDREAIAPYELDIYIPSLKVGIEYDGEAWHKDNDRDLLKTKLCEEKGIFLYRVREKKCPIIDIATDNVKIYTFDYYDYDAMTKIIIDICANICDIKLDVDVRRDENLILDQFASNKKGKSLSAMFPSVAEEWDYDKNYPLTPDKVSYAARNMAWWLCKNNHSFQQKVSDRTRKIGIRKDGRMAKPQGCPYCCNKKILKGFNDLFTTHPHLEKMWDYTKNDISPAEISYGSGRKVWWICEKCHSFERSVDKQVNINNCPICKKIK